MKKLSNARSENESNESEDPCPGDDRKSFFFFAVAGPTSVWQFLCRIPLRVNMFHLREFRGIFSPYIETLSDTHARYSNNNSNGPWTFRKDEKNTTRYRTPGCTMCSRLFLQPVAVEILSRGTRVQHERRAEEEKSSSAVEKTTMRCRRQR